MYRIVYRAVERPIELFAPLDRDPIALAPLMRSVNFGDIVQLGDGTYTGPVVVPEGVVLRGLGGDRTIVDGGGSTAVTLGAGARLEHLTVRNGPLRIAWFPSATVELRGTASTVLGCRVDGHVVVRANDAQVRATAAGGSRGRRRPAVGDHAMPVHRHAMGRRDPPDRRQRTPRQFL